METYSYTISGDFSGNIPKYSQLHNEIKNNKNILPILLGINSNDDNVDIIFDSVISNEEQTILNDLILNHSPISNVGITINNLSIANSTIDSHVFSTIASMNFPGTDIWKDVTNIKIISIMEEGGNSYNVRIYDITNNNLICSKILSNEDEGIYDLGTIHNLPETEAIFEIQAKVTGNTIAHVKNLNIYYD